MLLSMGCWQGECSPVRFPSKQRAAAITHYQAVLGNGLPRTHKEADRQRSWDVKFLEQVISIGLKKCKFKNKFKDFKVVTTEHCTSSEGSPSECKTLCLSLGCRPLKLPHTISIQEDKVFSSLVTDPTKDTLRNKKYCLF